MGKGLFFIKGVNTWINPMQVSSIYRVGESWHVAMANGSDYTIAEDEYSMLLEACKPHEIKFEQKSDKFDEFLNKLKAMMAEEKAE